MRLSFQTDYSLRILMYLAVREQGLSRVADIAASFRISHPHLLKVGLKLGRLNYITTVRGRKGGIKLARSPSEVRLGSVIGDVEEDLAIVECLGGSGACVISSICKLKVVTMEARRAFLECYDQYTLADIVRDGAGLQRLLGPAPIETTPINAEA